MTLSEKDGKLFYELWFPLLDYVNEKCKINKRVKNITNIKSLNPKEIKEIANVLWENVTFIDRYVEERGRKSVGGSQRDYCWVETASSRKFYNGTAFEKRNYFYLGG